MKLRNKTFSNKMNYNNQVYNFKLQLLISIIKIKTNLKAKKRRKKRKKLWIKNNYSM